MSKDYKFPDPATDQHGSTKPTKAEYESHSSDSDEEQVQWCSGYSQEFPSSAPAASFPDWDNSDYQVTPTDSAQDWPSFEFPQYNVLEWDEYQIDLESLIKPQRKRGRASTLNMPVIAIDTEYVRIEGQNANRILCYSYAIGEGENYCTGIIETKSGQRKDRINLSKLLSTAIQQALDEEVLFEWPEHIILGAHFLRVDLFTLADAFTDIKTKINGIRKTVASLEAPYGVDVEELHNRQMRSEDFNTYDKSKHVHRINVRFYDSMLFAPAGKGLADVGEQVGLEKIEIRHPYSIERMDEFQREQPNAFRRYAINDAEISYLHINRMISFTIKELDLSGLPFTIGGMATRTYLNTIGDKYRELFGLQTITKEVWPKQDYTPTGKKQSGDAEKGKKSASGKGAKRSGPRTVKGDVPVPARSILESFATECYHGGRNECFISGPTEIGSWNDFDAPSCYTVILSECKPLDYEAMRMSHDPSDYKGEVFGLARVRFKFPDDTRFPSLPVKTEKYGLYYPLEGVSYCTAAEIEVALSLKCDIQILQGFIIPWKNKGKSLFAPFMKRVRKNRLKHPKKSFEERLWKEIGNSLYGKLAQGLSGKTAFDVKHGISSPIQSSQITNPYFAAHVTGFARALMSEMIASVPAHREVVSVTTDGFLTNAALEEIDLSGPICSRFRKLYYMVDPGGGEILELKHKAKQLIAMKTRGQLTAIEEVGYEPVIAKAGVQVPKKEKDQHKFMLDLYLNRQPDQKVSYSSLTSSRSQFLNNWDVVNDEKKIRLNLEPDFKRELINPRMVKVRDTEHIAFDSRPHRTRADGEFKRSRLDLWRKHHCLKTLSDWYGLEEYLKAAKITEKTSLRIQAGEAPEDIFKRLFLRAYAQEAMGLKRTMTYAKFSDWLTENGYETPATQCRSAKSAKLEYNVMSVTQRTLHLLRLILTRFPEFRYQEMFAKDELDELEREIAFQPG